MSAAVCQTAPPGFNYYVRLCRKCHIIFVPPCYDTTTIFWRGMIMKTTSLILTSAFLLGMGGYALAADAVVQEEVIVESPAFTWTGVYVGGQVGYVWGDGDFAEDSGDITSNPKPRGWLGGMYAGYNYQMDNNVVLGGEADFAWTGADDDTDLVHDGGGVHDSLSQELQWEGAVRARLGYAVDRFLPYIAGGVAFGRVKTDAEGESDDTSVGWTLGGGVEYAFTDNLIGRAEYRYTDFGNFDSSFHSGSETDLTTSDVRLGIAWKF